MWLKALDQIVVLSDSVPQFRRVEIVPRRLLLCSEIESASFSKAGVLKNHLSSSLVTRILTVSEIVSSSRFHSSLHS